jgi:hypothetical protein
MREAIYNALEGEPAEAELTELFARTDKYLFPLTTMPLSPYLNTREYPC